MLRTAFSLGSVYAPLLADLPEGAFPGEDPGLVLIDDLHTVARLSEVGEDEVLL